MINLIIKLTGQHYYFYVDIPEHDLYVSVCVMINQNPRSLDYEFHVIDGIEENLTEDIKDTIQTAIEGIIILQESLCVSKVHIQTWQR